MAERINLPGGGVAYTTDFTDKIDQLKRKIVFDQYAEKVVHYQRFVKSSISDNMAKGILELCAAMIFNDNPSEEEMDEFAEKTAKKWEVDCEELCSEFFEFSDYVHGDSI
jgi:hypothetical protein